MSMKLTTFPLTTYTDEIEAFRTFSFVRYGDGEWSAMFGQGRKNCDGNRYTPEIKAQLTASLVGAPNGKYQTGMQKMALRMWGSKIYRWLEHRNVARPWHNADVFHTANQKGKLYPFVRLLNDRPSVLVAPKYMENLPIDFNDHIVVPGRNAETDRVRIVSEMKRLCPGAITCCCLGLSAAAIIREAYDAIGADSWLLDVGSIFDPYVSGGRSRRYFSKLTPKIKASNFGKDL